MKIVFQALQIFVSAGIAGLYFTGCMTSPSQDPFAAAAANNFHIIKKLNDTSNKTLNQLNKTASSLQESIDKNEKHNKELQAIIKSNGEKLASLNSQLKHLTTIIYNQLGLSTSTGDILEQQQQGMSSTTLQPLEKNENTQTQGKDVTSPAAQQAVKTQPTQNALMAYQDAQKYYINGNYEEAAKRYLECLKRYPDSEFSARAQYWAAESYRQLGKEKQDPAMYEKAITGFSKMRAMFPNSNMVPSSLYREALAHRALGQNTRATDLLKQVIKDYPLTPAAELAKTTLSEIQSGQ